MNYNNPDEAWYHELKRRPQGEGCLLSMLGVTFIALAIALYCFDWSEGRIEQ